MKTAILVDGGFYTGRAQKKYSVTYPQKTGQLNL